jgi:hypothetical protein
MSNSSRSWKPRYDLIFFGLLTIAGCAGGAAYLWPYLQNALAGPQPIAQAELSKIENIKELKTRWVKFPLTRAMDTEIRLVKQVMEQEESKYVLLEIEDRYLFAEVDPDFGEKPDAKPEIVGLLKPIATNGYIADAVAQFRADKPEYSAKLLPLVFQADYDVKGDAFAYNGLLAVGAFIGAGMAVFGIRGGEPELPVDQFDEFQLAGSSYDDDQA